MRVGTGAGASARQLAIIGEALSQLAKVDQGLAARIPELRRVIDFRNVLIQGYDRIDNAGVWRKENPAQVATLQALPSA